MNIDASISTYLGLVVYGTHGIEMQYEGRKIAVFANHKNVEQNWREAVMFAIGWHQTLFCFAAEAEAYATAHEMQVYTWQCDENENWLRRGMIPVNALCYTVLPSDAPESVRLANDKDADEDVSQTRKER